MAGIGKRVLPPPLAYQIHENRYGDLPVFLHPTQKLCKPVLHTPPFSTDFVSTPTMIRKGYGSHSCMPLPQKFRIKQMCPCDIFPSETLYIPPARVLLIHNSRVSVHLPVLSPPPFPQNRYRKINCRDHALSRCGDDHKLRVPVSHSSVR